MPASLGEDGMSRDFLSSSAGALASPPFTLETRLYEGGLVVKWRSVVRVVLLSRLLVLERRSCLYGLLVGRIRRNWMFARAQVQQGGQAARRKAAPRGANFSLRESMCQIAWASLRARSTWATLAPRCFPSRRLVRW